MLHEDESGEVALERLNYPRCVGGREFIVACLFIYLFGCLLSLDTTAWIASINTTILLSSKS